MAHSVQNHLDVSAGDYDRRIRALVPAYDEMRSVQLELLASALPAGAGTVLDLGGGTGSLAAAIAQRFPDVAVHLWDTDPHMLSVARERCASFGERIEFHRRSFTEPLPPCAAVVASLSLHHVNDLAVKTGIYHHIRQALRPGGIFVNADTAVPAAGALRDRAFRLWAETMAPHGIAPGEALALFKEWSKEDYYPPLCRELGLLTDAGFAEPEVWWRQAAAVVFGAAA